MINRINSYNSATNVRFGAYKPTLIKRINVSNLRDSQQKINSIKKVCEEIFSAIKLDKSIIEKVNLSLKSIKIEDNSILFFDGLENSIKYSKAKTNDKDLFIMEILNNNLPKISIVLDTFGSLVKDYNGQSFNYFDSEEINKELLEESFDKFYKTTDEPLFKLRMFIRKNTSIQENNVEKIKIEVPEVESYVAIKKPSEKEVFLEQKADLIKKLPVTGSKHNYSYKEVIQQNNQQEKVLIRKGLLAPKQYQEEVLGASILSRIDRITQRAKRENEREAKRQIATYKIAERKKETSEKKVEKTEIKIAKTKEKKVAQEAKTAKIKIVKPKIKKVKVKKEVLPKIKEKKVLTTKEPSVKRKVGRPRKEVVVNEQVLTEKKHRGRPKKTESASLENNVKEFKKKGNIEVAGNIDVKTKEQVNRITNLYNDILNLLSSLSGFTISLANSVYQKVKLGKRKITIDDIVFQMFKRKTWGESEAITITDAKTNNKLNILDSSKIISSKFDLDKLVSLDKTTFLTQNEIENESQKNILSNILNQAISKFEDYKIFLERRNWRSVERRIATADEGKLQSSQIELLNVVEEKYNRIRSKLQKMNSNKSYCIKRDYGIVPIKSARLEFIDAHKDGYNLIFSKAKTKYGDLYIVVRHSGKDVLEEVFAISQDGKLVKNINKNFGLNKIINHKEENIKFINNEQIEKENLLPRLEEVLSSLNKKMDDCEEYINNHKYVKK